MIVLGVDPGTARLGWGVIDTGEKHRVDQAVCLGYGCIETDKGMTDAQRLVAIAQGLQGVCKQYTPDLVSVEKLFFAKNQKTVMTVSQARGVILYMLEIEQLAVVEFTPMQVKQGLTGYGKAEKQQIQQMVKLLLHLPSLPQPDDAADGLALALTAAQVGSVTRRIAG
jgi:crossover junction endodeoxyribonuclease RuvC